MDKGNPCKVLFWYVDCPRFLAEVGLACVFGHATGAPPNKLQQWQFECIVGCHAKNAG